VAAGDIVPVPGAQFEETLAAASPDVLRAMIREFAQRMMDADVEVACNAGYGEVTPDRVNSRNGYRRREWDTRAGTIELAIPKLRAGSYFPSFLEHRRRAERALASVVATSYLLGVSTRRVEKLAASLGVVGLSKSQVSVMAAELDEMVDGFRNRPLDRGPYTFVWIDALTQKVREGGRTVNVHCLIATGVNADGKREILGLDVTSSEDGAGWLAFLRGLVARGLSGVALVISDDHAGLVNAIAAVLPGASWQRCRAHYSRNLATRVPKSAQPWVSTLVRTIFEQPDAASVRAQHAQVVAALEAKFPAAAEHLDDARDDDRHDDRGEVLLRVAAPDPAHLRDLGRGEDTQREHQPVGVERDGTDVDDAVRRARDVRQHGRAGQAGQADEMHAVRLGRFKTTAAGGRCKRHGGTPRDRLRRHVGPRGHHPRLYVGADARGLSGVPAQQPVEPEGDESPGARRFVDVHREHHPGQPDEPASRLRRRRRVRHPVHGGAVDGSEADDPLHRVRRRE